jgi:hypothetical protein
MAPSSGFILQLLSPAQISKLIRCSFITTENEIPNEIGKKKILLKKQEYYPDWGLTPVHSASASQVKNECTSPLQRSPSVCEALFYYAWTPIPSPDNYTGRFPWSQVSDRK